MVIGEGMIFEEMYLTQFETPDDPKCAVFMLPLKGGCAVSIAVSVGQQQQ